MKKTFLIFSLILLGPMINSAFASGTNIGGGNTSHEFTAQWSRNQIATLQKYKKRARTKLNRRGDYFAANKILVNGMKVVLMKTTTNTSFTRKALVRGVAIANFIGAGKPGHSNRTNRSIHNILNQYYHFVIDDVARNLDLYSYIPYLRRDRAVAFDATVFERNFVAYAAAQLKWVNDHLATLSYHRREMQITPIGNSEEYLFVSQLTTMNTAKDLTESLWSYRFACAIDALTVLNESIANYNLGNRDIYEDEKDAIATIYIEIEDNINKISKNDSCL